jgi:hypothetical protein
VTLALLMGGGLVLFGIGGDVQGGLFDAFNSGSNDGSGALKKQVESAQKKADAAPQDPAAWASLARASVNYAGIGDGYNQDTRAFTAEGRKRLGSADRAWQKYVELAGNKPDVELATLMANAYDQGALNKPDQAVRAYELVLEQETTPAYGDYMRLAQLAFAAGQTRKGDLAGQRAEELAPKDQKQAVKQAVQQLKTSGAGAAVGATSGG